VEGLQNLMSDMLAAAKRGDNQRVDELMKQIEFADYARYFVSTYSPDALAAEDWAVVYRRWLSDT
jgi:pantothenate kinase